MIKHGHDFDSAVKSNERNVQCFFQLNIYSESWLEEEEWLDLKGGETHLMLHHLFLERWWDG